MATGAQRTRSLHNFPFLSSWGCRRQARCGKISAPDIRSDGGGNHSPALDHRCSPASLKSYHDKNITELPPKQPEPELKKIPSFELEKAQKSPCQFQQQAVNMGSEVPVQKSPETDMPPLPPLAVDKNDDASMGETRPWNLRNQRTVGKKLNGDYVDAGRKANYKRLISSEGEASGKFVGEKRPRTKVSEALTKQEIEEDFLALTGRKPPKKQKKKPNRIQKQLEEHFPGFWSTEFTADMYKVKENSRG